MDRLTLWGRISLLRIAVALLLLLSARSVAFADSGTWTGATNGDWNTDSNWTLPPLATYPNGSSDIATFGTSGTTSISLSANVILDSAVFNLGASAYSITANSGSLDFQGAGVTNNSTVIQNFATSSTITFENSASAGSMAVYTNTGTGSTQFNNSATAASATIDNSGSGSSANFNNSATAANAVINNDGSNSSTVFSNSATAGNATITNNAANSSTVFTGTASGGAAALVNANSTAFIDISGLTNGMTAGSIAGNGFINLGGNTLTVGGNNTDTTFSGVIQDGGLSGGVNGYLTKVGTGTLTLSGNNTYTGDTEVDGGELKVTGSLTNGFDTFVGTIIGNATLSASGGGTISGNYGFIGYYGGTGTVKIDGAGSTWSNTNDIDVGDNGTGTLNITNGGKVSNINGVIGDSGTGTVAVDGTNSTWANSGTITIGNSGTGSLSVTNGGVVSNTDGTIGNGSSSSMGTVTVDGSGSQWNSSGQLTVANGGSGMLTITNSGVVSAVSTIIGANGIVVDDSSLVSPTVSVQSGGLLKGLGTVTGDVTNDGMVSPGHDAALGTLHLAGSYVQNSGGTLNIAIGSLSFYDQLAITGNATLNGTLDVTLAGYTGNAGDVFRILSSTGLTGNFATMVLPSLSPGLYFTESTDLDNVYLTVNQSLSGVPEPSTWVAGFLAAITLAFSFWRRRAARM